MKQEQTKANSAKPVSCNPTNRTGSTGPVADLQAALGEQNASQADCRTVLCRGAGVGIFSLFICCSPQFRGLQGCKGVGMGGVVMSN